MTGIEPAFSAWEADVLPLNYIRRLGRGYTIRGWGGCGGRGLGGRSGGGRRGPPGPGTRRVGLLRVPTRGLRWGGRRPPPASRWGTPTWSGGWGATRRGSRGGHVTALST